MQERLGKAHTDLLLHGKKSDSDLVAGLTPTKRVRIMKKTGNFTPKVGTIGFTKRREPKQDGFAPYGSEEHNGVCSGLDMNYVEDKGRLLIERKAGIFLQYWSGRPEWNLILCFEGDCIHVVPSWHAWDAIAQG